MMGLGKPKLCTKLFTWMQFFQISNSISVSASLCCLGGVQLQFVIKMIDKKSLDFVFVAPKLKVNKMVGSVKRFIRLTRKLKIILF